MEENCCSHVHDHEDVHTKNTRLSLVLNIIGILFFIIAIIFKNTLNYEKYIYLTTYIISYTLLGYEIVLNAIKKLFKKDMFDENFLMTIATLGAFYIGEYTEGVAVLLFYKIGEFLQDLAVKNSVKKIESAIDIRADYANLVKDDKNIKVRPEELKIDDIIVVKNGEKIPLDGIVVSGKTNLDTSALTGESMPREVEKNDKVLSGTINLGAVIEVKVTSTYEKSTVYKVIELIQNASSKKSQTEKFITKFAKIYTPIVTLLSVLIAILFPFILDISFAEALKRALSFLVVSCPCALVVSIPLGFFVGIGASSKKGILVKGSNYLDLLSNTKKVIFDKTGTLTKGKFSISTVETVDNTINKEEMLEYIAICESYSNHYIAKSVVESYKNKIDLSKVSYHEEISGKGVKAVIDGKDILVGNAKLLDMFGIEYEKVNINETIVYISIENKYVGYITLADTLKTGTENLTKNLKKIGVNETVLLTGDNKGFAKNISDSLGIDEVYADLLPQDKANIFEKIKDKAKDDVIVYVGDGINDGVVIAQADVGIAMGKGADIAIETADVVLMNDEIEKIVDSIKIAKRTKFIVRQNIIIVISVKIIFLILSGAGISTMWEAVFADVGMALMAILNSLRIAKLKY